MKEKILRRMNASRIALLSLSMFMLFLTGCQDKDYSDPDRKPPGYVGDDPSTLDFSTTQKVVFDLNYDVPDGTVSTFQAYSVNPFEKKADGWEMRSDLQPITAGIYVAGGAEIVRTLPSYVTDVYLYSPDLFAPTLMHAKINDQRAVFQEIDLVISQEAAATRTYGTAAVDHYLTGNRLQVVREGANTYYRPYDEYIIKEEFPAAVRNSITKAFPNGQKADPKYYTDASFYIAQDGGDGKGVELWVSVIASDAKYHNSLAYFCYDGPKEDLAKMMTNDARKDLYVISVFQSARVSLTASGALKPGEYVKLKYYNKTTGALEDKFPVGTTVGWVLAADGFTSKSDGYYIKGRTESSWYYSVPSWHFEYKGNKNHTTIFTAKNGGNEYVCFGFEDENNDSQVGDGDCNDVMFHVKLNPTNAIVPPPVIPGEDNESETEQDATEKGYLAFEDNWPRKGDYDLNDVVVKYESTINYVQKTESGKVGAPYVRKVVDNFSLVHAGADFANSFGYKVEVNPQRITKVTVDGNQVNIVPDGSGFLVELCPNVNEVIKPYVYGTTPKTYNVVMEFSEQENLRMTQAEFNQEGLLAPYNPYISPKDGVEVHLPMYRPTAKATTSLFGTDDDRSGNGLWYVSGENNNYPFAIHLSGVTSFTIPVEEQSIDKTYPKYNSWVESYKHRDKDWYLYPVGN
ncbi:LruC domain-containing protein [Bacteroides sp. 51]|uniref:LruC domain-containing protein n=1 Tax=Bacteroides sp. 51 TaxID=2302938 RepID=UPI0013D7A4B8|nr:LruC domain-containing protein [Bacteroides sp. 51]NDV82651.1 LruC domain-containing protein [Bacteroides sp. 51]